MAKSAEEKAYEADFVAQRTRQEEDRQFSLEEDQTGWVEDRTGWEEERITQEEHRTSWEAEGNPYSLVASWASWELEVAVGS